ncbi:hypothetical protein ACJX0J_011118, partial [Zea mays]
EEIECWRSRVLLFIAYFVFIFGLMMQLEFSFLLMFNWMINGSIFTFVHFLLVLKLNILKTTVSVFPVGGLL